MITGMLTPHFSRAEVVRSHTAEHDPRLAAAQLAIPDECWESALHLAVNCLEPARQEWGVPFHVHSWYRSPSLNRRIRGSRSSQHLRAEAVDIHVDRVPNTIRELVWRWWPKTSSKPRVTTPTWYLWSYLSMRLEDLDIDQVIHEFGKWGAPQWVHVASSARKDDRVVSVAFRETAENGEVVRSYRHYPSFAAAADDWSDPVIPSA